VDAGVIVYRVTADLSELSRAEGQAGQTFSRIGASGEQAFSRITRALEESARLITGALAAAFDLSPDQLVAGSERATQALERLRQAARETELGRVGTETQELARALDAETASAETAARATSELGEAADEAARRSGGLLERLGQFGMAAFGIQQAAQALQGLLAPLAEFGRSAIDAASDANESFSKLRAVFGDLAVTMNQTLAESARTMGLSRGEAAEAVATFGNLFTSMGLSRAAAADMSVAMVQLAADIASFNNLTLDEALMKLRSGLVGEIEPLRSIGVAFNEAAVQAKALEMGLAASGKELTEQEKVLARYQLIMELTRNAQGDFARTSDQLANSQRILRAELQNLREQLGAALLPIVTTVVQKLADAISWFERMPAPVRDVTVALVALAGALGVVLPLLGGVAIAVGALSAPVVAAIAVVGALGAAAIVLARNWDTIRERFPAVGQAVDRVRSIMSSLGEDVRRIWPAIRETIAGVIDIVILQFEKFFALLGGFGRAIVAAFRGEFGQIDDIVRDTATRVKDLSLEQVDAGRRIVDAWRNVGQSAAESSSAVLNLFTALREGGRAVEAVRDTFVETISVFQQFDAALGASNAAISRWESQLREAQEALGQLEEKRRSGVALTTEEQRQYETLTWYVARLQGGIADLESQQRSILVAQAEYTRALDELNAALEQGKITQDEYNRRVGELNAQYSAALGPAEQFRQAGERVADALGQVANRLEDVLRGLGLLPPRVEIDIQSTAERQAEHIRRLNMEIDRLPNSFTITANVNIAPALESLAQLNRNLPHSPAEEGPLSREPNWAWLFEGLATAAEKATSETLERLRSFVGGVREVLGAIRETFALVATWQRQGDPWEAAWGELLDWFQELADRAISGLADAARKFDQEALGRVRDLMDAVSAVMRGLRDVVEVAGKWAEIGDPWDMAWGELEGWLAELATSMIESLARAADVVGLQATVKARELAESMGVVIELLGNTFRVAEQGTVTILANLQTLWENRDTIARSIADLAVSLVESVGDALSRAGAVLPEREESEALFAPVVQVLGVLDRLARLTEEGITNGQKALGKVSELAQTLVSLASELARMVRDVASAIELPERALTDALFAPLQAVANLLSTLDRLGSGGKDAAPRDPAQLVRSLMDAVRSIVDGLGQLASVQLPPLDQLASLLAVLDVIERVSQSLAGSIDRLTQAVNPQRAAGAASGFVGAIRAWVSELANLANAIDPGVADAVARVMQVIEPIATLATTVSAILEKAGQAPRDWQARLEQFAQAVRTVLETIVAIRDQLAGGLDQLASVVANWNAALGTLAGTAQGASLTVNATQNLSLAATIQAAVDVRVWVGETELRSIVREEVDAAVREALVRAV
jgi:hypothetical protein